MYQIIDLTKAEALFEGMEESLVWSCLEGTMGWVYGDDPQCPKAAMAMLGDFCFFAGRASRELVRFKPEECERDFMIMVPPNEAWAGCIEACFGEKAKKVTRYAIKKEAHVWDLKRLCSIVAGLPEEYESKLLDEAVFAYARENHWASDWVSQFPDYESFRDKGLGFVILKDGIPVSGASSYSVYSKGIEIEIDTQPDYRRRGLAAVCGAGLILECEKRGLYPSWDAQNLWSVALAEKLGYRFDHEYTAYEIRGY